ncbi:MAG: AI-2E family transporter [Gammaproteobacteria bacterium]|nr:AI-2E family transporter [Pseudomonadales bacterium]
MNNENIRRTFFVFVLVAVTIAFFWLIRGFLQPIFWAVALAIVFYPAHRQLEQRLPRRPRLSAALSVIAVLLVVVLPLTGIVAAVTGEASLVYQQLRDGEYDLAGIFSNLAEYLPTLERLLDRLGIEPQRLTEQLSSAASTMSGFVANWALEFGQDTLRIAVFFFLMLYLLYFFLLDGHRILDGLVHALPLGDQRERTLLNRFVEVSRATIKGSLVIGMVQGAIGGVAFALLGIGAPVLWGVVMALLSIVPAVGPALVWFPAVVYLVLSERIVAGIVLLLIGTVIISLVDNLLRPLLVGRDTRLPDYLILLSTLGGLTAFGLAGVIIGPIIASFFLTVWEMAIDEFADIDSD